MFSISEAEQHGVIVFPHPEDDEAQGHPEQRHSQARSAGGVKVDF
jgi:hypothetical protein